MKKYFWYILLILLVVPSFFSIIRSGFFPMQDDMQIFRLYEMDKCVKDFQIPCRWIPDGGYRYGYPQFNFYAPLVYYLGEGFHLIGFQFVDTVKILIALGFVFSALAMFVLVREFFGDFPGLVAALLYTYAPYHAQQVYVRGSLSEFWASVFFPLILWSIYKKKFFWIAVSVAGLFLTHNILSFLFIPIIIFWMLYWKKTTPAILLGIGLSAFFVLPMIFERGYVHVETLLGGYFDYRQHFVTLKELFLSNHWGYGSSALGPVDDLSLSTGIVQWILGAIAVVMALLRFKKDKKISMLILGLGLVELTTLFLMHERSSALWARLSFLSWLQFPWRFLSLSVFLLSFLAAYAIANSGKVKYILGLVAIAGVLILHATFFAPRAWLNVSDRDELTGMTWEKELTASIFDYLPIYATLPPNSKASALPEVLEGNAVFVNYAKGSYFQGGEIKVVEDAVIRVPLYDFPGMGVKVDGKIVEHVNSDCREEEFCLGLITFKVPAGSHKITVQLYDTPVRRIGNILTVVSLAMIAFFSTQQK